jgi:hypothetical protein
MALAMSQQFEVFGQKQFFSFDRCLFNHWQQMPLVSEQLWLPLKAET